MCAAEKSAPQIAKALGRYRTTIKRELRRNGMKGLYVADTAQRCAEKRRRLKSEFPGDKQRRLSRTTIYTWIKCDDHCRCWQKLLRCHKRKRRNTRPEGWTGRALEKRPAIINKRGRFGDWEGDTIVGSGPHGGVIVGLVERKSRFVCLLPLSDRKSDRVERSIRGRLQQLPAELRRSITFDNGSEFAAYAALENSLGLDVYFTDPHSAWQRGTNLREVSDYKIAEYEPTTTELSTPEKCSTKPASVRFKLDCASRGCPHAVGTRF